MTKKGTAIHDAPERTQATEHTSHHHTNIGYTLPRRVFAEGGYQPMNTHLVPGGAETIFEEILEMLTTLAR